LVEINGIYSSTKLWFYKILELTPGINTQVETFFRDIALGAAAVAGVKPPRTP